MDNNQNLQTKFVVENLNKATFVGVTKVYSAIETNISFVLGNENICIYCSGIGKTQSFASLIFLRLLQFFVFYRYRSSTFL